MPDNAACNRVSGFLYPFRGSKTDITSVNYNEREIYENHAGNSVRLKSGRLLLTKQERAVQLPDYRNSLLKYIILSLISQLNFSEDKVD